MYELLGHHFHLEKEKGGIACGPKQKIVQNNMIIQCAEIPLLPLSQQTFINYSRFSCIFFRVSTA